MAFKTYLLIVLLTVFTSRECYAQLKLPIFDVELKIEQNIIPGFGGDSNGSVRLLETTNVYGGAHVQLNQHIALGGFYSRSFRGTGQLHYDNNTISKEVLFLQKGLDVRFSTSRAKKWRRFLSVNYSQIELVQVNGSYRLAGKTNAFGVSWGIMRRLSHNLYLNVMGGGVKVMADEIFWFYSKRSGKGEVGFIADIGLTYNIGKRK